MVVTLARASGDETTMEPLAHTDPRGAMQNRGRPIGGDVFSAAKWPRGRSTKGGVLLLSQQSHCSGLGVPFFCVCVCPDGGMAAFVLVPALFRRALCRCGMILRDLLDKHHWHEKRNAGQWRCMRTESEKSKSRRKLVFFFLVRACLR